ncbi:MAG: molybdopterin-dependent oxidoreductase [Pirellulales bacterium]
MLPPNQHLVAPGKWPIIGEQEPRTDVSPWTVSILGAVERPLAWSLEELRSLPQVERVVDIHCVTRWSKLGVRFSGVALADLLAHAAPAASARFVSFVARSARSHSTSLPLADTLNLETLIALAADGNPLDAERGGPVRVIVPGRYFYKSLKWLETIELLTDDRLGYWEATAGYHNHADPWREERYLAPTLSCAETAALLTLRNWSDRDLRGIAAGGHALEKLVARNAILRDADFRRCELRGADFRGANLSNAHFADADLRTADFADADCEGADFAGADLRGVNFQGASLFGATLFADRIVTQLDAATRFSNKVWSQLVPDQATLFCERLDAI